jgi:hypothetical protein
MRSLAERVARLVAMATLAWYLAYVLKERKRGHGERASSAALISALARWSTVASPSRVHVDLQAPPPGQERDWLAALAGASTAVEWSGPSLVPTALAIEPRADPAGGADAHVAAPVGAWIRLADTLGVLDSAYASRAGMHAHIPNPRATVDAIVGAVDARAARHDSLELRRLLVIGGAGWETKFTVAALEERGWTVDVGIALSATRIVRQGTIADVDTSRYSAVLAIDSTVVPYADRVARFVRMGGGLVLWSEAAKSPALAAIAPGVAGTETEDEGTSPTDSAPRAALGLAPITSLSRDAVVLERRGEAVSVAARRVGLGRVIETGYTTLWRWRMAGGDDAPDRHREWLAGLVAGVAHTGRFPIAAPPTDVAPLASLIDRVGAPTTHSDATSSDPDRVARWVFVIACLALVAEWASRRTRGAK